MAEEEVLFFISSALFGRFYASFNIASVILTFSLGQSRVAGVL